MAKRYIWDFNAPAGGNLKTWDEWESEQAERSLDLMNAVKSPGIKTYKPGELDLYDSSITPEHVDKNALLDALSTSQKPSLVKRIEDSKAWRTVIGNPEEGYGVGDMAEAVMMANPAVTGMAAGKGLQGAGTVLKKVGDPALDALKTALFKTPAPVKKLAGAGAAITGYETIKGATDPEYADRRETFPSQFGASLRGGVGDAVKLAGSAAEWQGKDKLADTLKQAGIDISEGFESKQVPFTWKSWFDPDWYANNVARTIPTTAALIPAMVIAYKGGAQGAAMRGFGKFGQAVIGSLAGAAASRPLESAMEAGGAYEDALARGLSTEEAEAAAQKVYEANLSLAGLDAAQLALAFAPQGKLAGLAGRIGKTGVAASKLAGVALTEAGEEGYQQAVQQSATGADQRGILAQMLNPNTEMKESMAIGGLFGVGMGGAGVINDVFANPADLPDRIQKDVAANLPPELKTQVAQNIENFMDQGMDEAAATEKALDELAETPEGQGVIAASTQAVANDILNQGTITPLSAEELPQYIEGLKGAREQAISDQVKYLKSESGKGVTKRMPKVDDEGYTIGWLAGHSNNPPWYQALYAQLGRSPNQGEWRTYAEKSLREGYDDIPPDAGFLRIENELSKGIRLPEEWHSLEEIKRELMTYAEDDADIMSLLSQVEQEQLAIEEAYRPQSDPQAEQVAQPQQDMAEAPAPNIVYDRSTGEPLQVVGQPNPEFYVVQNQAGKRRLAQIGDVTIGVPAAQETGQAPAEETNVPPQAAQELTGEAVPQPQPQAAIKVQPEQTAAAQSETEAGVNDTTWYHGTGKQGLTPEAIDPLIGNHEALFGHGVYLTDSPNVAQGYAKARSKKSGAPSVYEVKVNVNSTLDLEGEVAPEFSEIMLSNSEFDPGVRQTVQEAINEKGATNESVMQAYRHALEEYSADSQIPSSELVENFQDILIDLKRAGYDALTHAGGKRTGGAPHRVLIMLDPNDIAGTGRKDQITAFSQLNNVPEEKPAAATRVVVLGKPEAYNETKDDIKFLRGDGDQTEGGKKTDVDTDRGRDTDSLHPREAGRTIRGGQADGAAERRISNLTEALERIPGEDFRTDELRAVDAGEYEKADIKQAIELAETYGAEVFLFRWEKSGPKYFSATLVGNVIYIDADSNTSAQKAAAHELMHYLKRAKAKVYGKTMINASRYITGKAFSEYKKPYLERKYKEKHIVEELICDIGAQVLLKSTGMEGAFFTHEEWNNLFGSEENASKAEEAIGKVLAEGAVKDTTQKSPPEGQGPKLKREGHQGREARSPFITPEYAQQIGREKVEFSRRVDQWQNGQLGFRDAVLVGSTPRVMLALNNAKTPVKDLPVMINQSNLSKIFYDHKLTLNEIKDLPRQIHDPILVFDSKTEPGAFVIVTELQKGPNPVIVAFHVNKDVTGYLVNEIPSAYAKERMQSIYDWASEGLLRYQNTATIEQKNWQAKIEMSLQTWQQSRLRLPGANQDSGSEKSPDRFVTKGSNIPEVRGTGESSDSSILTEKDIVKAIETGPPEGLKPKLKREAQGAAAPIFYSQLRRVIEQKMPNRTVAGHVLAIIKGGQAKQEEVKWSGIEDWLNEQKGKVEKQDVLDFLKANEVQVEEVDPSSPKYHQYQLPGGENYREMLFTLPRKIGDNGYYVDGYSSSHWDEANVLTHVRFNDRTGPNGEKILHVEEVQSDWHQEGRKKGYASDAEAVKAKIAKEYNVPADTGDWSLNVLEKAGVPKDLQSQWYDSTMRGKVPDAPFKTTWHEFVLKRMLRHGAENGYDRIAWTTGEQQAERYDLSNQVGSVTYNEKTGRLRAYKPPENERAYNGGLAFEKEGVKREELADYIGKDPAMKLLNSSENQNGTKTISGLDLKIGGEGMKGFYDRMIPSFLNKYAKKWGAKVHAIEIEMDGKETAVHSLPITDAMRESVLYLGQPMFKREGMTLKELSDELGLALKPAREAMLKPSFHAANILAKIFTGKDIVLFRGKGIQGATIGNTIFLNEKVKSPVLYVVKHEIIHALGNTDPESYAQLLKIAKEHFDGNPTMFKHYEDYGYAADEAWDEFTSDVVSEIMESDGFWAKVREKAPELVRTIIDIIDNIIAQYKKAVSKKESMLKHIQDMEEFKAKVAGVTAEALARRQQGTAKPGAGGEVAAKTSLKREKEAINTANAKTEAERLNDQNMLEFFQKVIEEYGIKSTPEALYQQVFKKEMSAEVRQRIMKNTLQDRYVGWRNEDSRAVSAQKDMQAFVGARILKARSEGNKDGTLPPVARRDIVKFLSDKLDIPIRVGRYRSKGALGIFKIRPEVIRTRLAEDIEVISHEIGHYLDKRLGLQSRHYDQEMKALAHGLKGPTREEGVAQFVNFWLTNPKKAKQLAPRYYESFQSKLDDNPEIAEVLESAQKQINTWLTQPAMERVLGQLSVGEGTLKRPMTFDRIYTAVVDELRPLENAVKSITQGHSIDDMVNPYLAAWAARGWRGKAEAAIHYGQFDNNLKKAGPSLNEILKKVDKQLDEFRAFITAKRTLELNERNISSGITAEDANDVINGFDAKTTKLFEDTFKELIEFQDYIMNQAVESGLVSKEALKTMRELNRNYVPFYRLFDESMQQQGFAGKTFANLASPIKSIKGSQRTIIDPIESIIKNTYTLINLSERQHVGRLLANLAARFEGSGKVLEKIATPMMPVNFPLKQLEKLLNAEGVDTDSIDLEHIATIFKPNYFAPRGKENILIIFNNGKPEFYQVAPELYRAMLFLDKESSNILDKLLTYPTSLLRAGATLTPEFIARNPVRDQFSAFVNSKYGFVPGVDLIRGLAHVIKKDELYWRWYQSGGAHGAFVSVDRDYLQKDMRKLLRREFKEKLADTLTHPMEVLRMLSEYTEEATRVMEFGKGLKKEGADRAKIAAIASRDITLDFSRAGHTGKAMNRWIAFLNAGIQGVDKMVRQFDPRDPQKAVMSTLKSVIAITLPTIILFALNKDNEYYQEIPRWEKDVFWLIPYNGGKNFIRIPKPFELGIIFGTIPERFMEYIYSQDSSAFDEIGETVKKYVFLDLVPDKDYMFAPPGLMPTALLPIMECWANKSSFTGYQIIPSREEGLEPGLQYGPTTSETAKIIGDAAGISPRKIEQMIYGYTAGMGRNVVTGTDWLLEKIGVRQRTPKPEGGLADIPLIKGFISTNPRSGQSITIERFYKDYNDAEVLYKSLDTRISNGENITADSLSKREIALLLSRKTLRKIAGELSDVRKVQRQVLGDKGITKENKQELLHRTDVMQINIVRGYYGQELLEP